jgi:hypothetical protein
MGTCNWASPPSNSTPREAGAFRGHLTKTTSSQALGYRTSMRWRRWSSVAYGGVTLLPGKQLGDMPTQVPLTLQASYPIAG